MESPGLAEFIRLGLVKDKWPHVTIELVQGFLDDPCCLDDEENNILFVERFYYYFDWYWRNQNDK